MTPANPAAVRAGRTLRMMREAHGVSLRFIAAAVDVTPGHLSRVESGERPASDELTQRICDVIAMLPAPVEASS